ncbi:MAG: signal peptidase II [Culicoidibacterales bacterium]
MTKKKNIAIVLIICAILFDQLTKWLAVTLLSSETITVIEGFFELRLLYNTGAAFSILADARWFFVGITIIILIMGWNYYLRYMEESLYFYIGGVLFFAGTMGNFIDRLLFGKVTDFLSFIFGSYHFAIFNIADTYLTISIVILGVGLFIYERKLGIKGEHDVNK